jgi:hypothetical protein
VWLNIHVRLIMLQRSMLPSYLSTVLKVSTVDNIDLAWLQSHLLQDLQSIETLVDAGLHPTDASKVLMLRADEGAGKTNVRVNLTGDSTFWLNDIESDEIYRCEVNCSVLAAFVASKQG